MKYVLLVMTVMLTACASNYVRVTEYSATGSYVPMVSGVAGGCQVSIEGEITGRLVYSGETCSYDSAPEDN